jgi:hypothetical protein
VADLRGGFQAAFRAAGLEPMPVQMTAVAAPAGFLLRELPYR